MLETKDIPKENFYKKIGMTSANFRGNARKTPLNSTAIENILTEVPDINAEWLLTGKGEILKAKGTLTSDPTAGIPLIPSHAMAGILQGDISVMELDCERYVVPAFRGADFLIPVKGSSMYPKYSSGDIVACKKIPLTDLFFQWNKVYVLDTVQGPLIKRVARGSDQEHILAISENTKYEPFELHISQLRAVAIVMGVIRLE